MSKLVLIRHGKTEYNEQRRFTGFTDVSISQGGENDATRVVLQLNEVGIQFDVAFTSRLKRAWETLDIVLAGIGQTDLEIIKHPFLNERHYGDLQGRFHEEMILEFGENQVQMWRRSYAVRPPNGESLQDVVYRVDYYLTKAILPRVKGGEDVLVSAHGNSNRAMVKLLEGISDENIVGREIAYDVPLIY